MGRTVAESWTTASVAAGASLTENRVINRNYLNVTKVKVVPSLTGQTSKFQIYKKDTHVIADIAYSSGDFAGTFYDPEELDGGVSTERNGGFVANYEDLDASGELHTKVWNDDSQAKTYTITVEYEPHPVSLTGTATWDPASLADGASESKAVTVTGATVLNSTASAGLSSITATGWQISANVTAADTVTVTITNHTGGVVDLASGTVRAHVWQE